MSAKLPDPPTLASLRDADSISLFIDFDGTLVPIAPRPDAIEVPDQLAARLSALADRMDGRVALVSGRALSDLEDHCGVLEVARAGSHGASRLHADGKRLGEAPSPLPDVVIAALRHFAAQNGLLYEGKTHGGALHYRSAPKLEDGARAFVSELAANNALAVKFGKGVAELVRPGADKAGAVSAFMAETPFRNSRPIFIGDDVTDEDGFFASAQFGGFGIAVGERTSVAAKYHLDTVAAVHQWLQL